MPVKLPGLSINGPLVRKLSSCRQYPGNYDESTKVVLSRATANIFSYLKPVSGVATFDLFWATETRSVFNALLLLRLPSRENVAEFCRQL